MKIKELIKETTTEERRKTKFDQKKREGVQTSKGTMEYSTAKVLGPYRIHQNKQNNAECYRHQIYVV